jgi:hypothetical protein
LFLLAAPLAAQDNDGNIARVVFFKARDGHNQELEAGLKKHMAWHKDQSGTWAWAVWSYETGESSGGYGAGTFGRNWADFDNLDVDEAADGADVAANIVPHLAPGGEWRYYQALMKVSKPSGEPAPLSEVIVFRLHYGKDADFMYLIKKFHKAIEKTEWPVNYIWYRLVNGGDMPEYVLVIPHENYASMKEPEKSFGKMLAEAVGQRDAESLLKQWTKAVKKESSSIIRSRPDLGYTPEGGM